MQAIIDYRNARFQGCIDSQNIRNGFGILIDDDLSFYASNWKDGKINDDSVIYISHGKYIYGQWHDNQPHGLNVFRIGDTVVLGEFDNGDLVKKAIIIFEKFNFLAILEQQRGEEWAVCQRGVLKSYNDLVKYIEQAGIPMRPQFFSLTKFLTHISNQKAAAVPCPNSENCYYGYRQGLGIIFNPNNGVVSVGCHEGKKLFQFGGKYELPNFVIEGNFQTNQIIKYTKQRPKTQIYSVFQKLHKRSLHFKNQYFDSKIKLLTHIEDLVRAKIDEIVNQNNDKNNQNTFTVLDLNDSLDYHAQNLEQLNKLNKIRQDVYEAVHIPLKKATSQYVQASPKASSKKSIPVTPTKRNSNLITNAPASPIMMKKSPLKTKPRDKQLDKQKFQQRESQLKQKQLQQQKDKERQRQIQRERQSIYSNGIEKQKERLQERQKQLQRRNSRIKQKLQQKEQLKSISRKSSIYLNRYEVQQTKQDVLINQYPESPRLLKSKSSQQQIQLPKSIINIQQRRVGSINQVSPFKAKYLKQNLNQMQPPSPIQQILVSSKDYIRQKQLYDVPSFKYSHSQFEKDSKTQTRFDNIKIGKYEQVQKIQNVQWIETSNGQSGLRQTSFNIKQSQQVSKSPIKGPNYENLSQRRKRLLKEFKNLNDAPEKTQSILSKIIPNILEKKIQMTHSQNLNKSSSTLQIMPTKQKFMQSCQELESPCARQKIPSYESKNTEQSQTFMPLTICRNMNQMQNNNTKKTGRVQKQQRYSILNIQDEKRSSYRMESQITQKYSKQNIDVSPLRRPFQKKESYHEKVDKSQIKNMKQAQKTSLNACTPTRKTYKYYFDQ